MICKHLNNHVIDSRPHATGIRRRRVCEDCEFRWNTYEISEAEVTRLNRMESRVVALISEVMKERGDDN
jgi:transcriptional regulator NrdR family protein